MNAIENAIAELQQQLKDAMEAEKWYAMRLNDSKLAVEKLSKMIKELEVMGND